MTDRKLLIDKPENRGRVLRACRNYERLRRDFAGKESPDKSTEAEPGLFDDISEGHKQ